MYMKKYMKKNGLEQYHKYYSAFKTTHMFEIVFYFILSWVQVRTWKMHLFTGIQVVALAILWAVKSTAASLAFPFLLILLIPVRKFLLPKIFSQEELKAVSWTDNTVL